MSGLTIRPCGPENSTQWAEFLDQIFGYRGPESYAVDFAPLFEPEALQRSRLVWQDGKIVSSATCYPVNVITPSGKIRLAIVGAVATHESYRGKGLSKAVLAEMERIAESHDCDGVVLWSDQDEFYAKLGYETVGLQHIYSLETLAPPKTLPAGTAVYGWDWDQVRKIYEKHPLRVERSDEYWQSIQNVKSCTRVQWMNDEGEVLAYLGFDRGKDLQGIVHEWGGSALELHALLWIVLHNRPNLMWLTHPTIEDPITPMLPQGPALSGHLALFKSLNRSVAAEGLKDVWFWGLDSL